MPAAFPHHPLPFLSAEFLRAPAGRLPAVIVPAQLPDGAAAEKFVAAAARTLAVDEHAMQAIEWRVDALTAQLPPNTTAAAWLAALYERGGAILNTLQKLGLPVLATLRTAAEGGGSFTAAPADYSAALTTLLRLPLAAVDIEHRREGAAALAAHAAAQGCAVVWSHHDWCGSPDTAQLSALLNEMHSSLTGAVPASFAGGVVKLACSPGTAAAAAEFAAAARQLVGGRGRSTIAIAMGQLGQPTRQLESSSGSAATFAALLEASAPGQLTVQQLMVRRRELLRGAANAVTH